MRTAIVLVFVSCFYIGYAQSTGASKQQNNEIKASFREWFERGQPHTYCTYGISISNQPKEHAEIIGVDGHGGEYQVSFQIYTLGIGSPFDRKICNKYVVDATKDGVGYRFNNLRQIY